MPARPSSKGSLPLTLKYALTSYLIGNTPQDSMQATWLILSEEESVFILRNILNKYIHCVGKVERCIEGACAWHIHQLQHHEGCI